MDTPTRLTPDEVAQRLRRSRDWVTRSANAGRIPGFKVGGLWRFDLADIERYENRHRTADPLSMTPLSAQRQAAKRA